MWLTRLSIQRPVFVIVLMSTLLLLGLFSRGRMQIEERPRVDIPYITITTVYPGTGPAEMESLITKPLEDSVSAVNGIRNITSSSQYGISFVQLEFFIGTNSQFAAQEVRQKVDGARRKLPRDVDPPVVDRFDINAQPVLYLGLRGDRSIKQLRFLADTQIRYRLAQVPGVGQVETTGGDVRELRVSVDRRRLEAWGMSITDVVSAIYRANANIPSGHMTAGKQDFDARLIGEFDSAEDLASVELPLRFGSQNVPLRLRDVATVRDTVAERQTVTRIWQREHPGAVMSGNDSVGLTVTKLADANTIEVVDAVTKELKRLEKDLPGNIRFQVTQDESRTVRNALNDINVSLVLGSLLAVFVVFLFLHDLRGTFICAVAIPTSLIASFIPMFFLGQSMNNMTMLGLSLVVGILVDDSIVVLECIHRHLHLRKTPRQAALDGRDEIGAAAVIITMVDVVVFLPMLWMGGIIGQFLRAFGLTVAVSTLFSLLVSFTVTPWLASRWYREGEFDRPTPRAFRWLDNIQHALDSLYRHLLGAALGAPRWFAVVVAAGMVVMIAASLLPGGSGSDAWFWVLAGLLVGLIAMMTAKQWGTAGRMSVFCLGTLLFVFTMRVFFPIVKIGYIPVYDQSRLGATVELSPGVSLEETDRITLAVEKAIAVVPEVKTVFTTVGRIQGGGRSAPETGRQYSQINVQLYEKPDLLEAIGPFADEEKRKEDWRKRTDAEVAAEIRKSTAGIPGARVLVVPVRGFSGISAPVQVELLGFDLDQLKEVGAAVRTKLAAIPGVFNTDLSLRSGKPEMQIKVDRQKASDMGLDVTTIGTAVRSAYEGNIDAKYREAGEQFDIRVQLTDKDRSRPEDMGRLVIGSVVAESGRRPVRLAEVASIVEDEGPTKIERKNRMRKATVSGFVLPGTTPLKVNQLIENELKQMPMGDIRVSAGGDADRARTEYPHLIASLMLSMVLVYLLMAVLFDNLLHPFTIQLSLPMALIGAVLALVWADQQLSIISITGFIMLGGIVQKNAILLIDHTNALRARGMDRDDAIRAAGPTRLRPILMTTLAMIAGMLPVALSVGRGNEARAPLATVVIGGLVMSTLLTLIIVPCIYSVFDDVVGWLGGVFRRRAPVPAPPAHADEAAG